MVKMDRDDLEAGRILSHPPPGEEVVISGQSGVYPSCDTTAEFARKLFNKEDLIREIHDYSYTELPNRLGKVNNVSKFDAGYFGIHHKQAHTMDPMGRMLLEQTAAAIFDAGYNPRSFYGKKVGVFIGACFSETEREWMYEKRQVNGLGITGCARVMLANRISYWLGVKGPSYVVDTACSSSMYAIDHAYKAIREGLCDAAIVGGVNLCMDSYVTMQFYRLGVLSQDGKCKTFDERADGYCRSEGVSAMLIQRRKDARRVYATIVHVKTNCDGYKEEGITFPSGPVQQTLLEEFYQECQVNPSELAWIEAHGTGTKVGDPAEIAAIANVFCPNRKKPLKVGSLKSNCGHSEPTSALLSATKVIVAMEYGYIPPNINFISPKKDIEALHNGNIEVITEKTPWSGGLVGVNSFGFGGANGHVLLKSNDKTKKNNSIPSDDLPRLVCISGRTSQAIDTILSHLENYPLDAELVTLFHHIYKQEVPGHLYRGYTIISKSNELGRSIEECPSMKLPFTYFFPGFGFEWKTFLEQLLKIPIILGCFTECCNTLKKENFDLHSMMSGKSNNKSPSFSRILMECLGQIILTRVLRNLGLEPDRIVGTSYGEIACAYADGSLTFDQAVLSSYFVAKALSQLDGQGECSAIIGLPYNKVKTYCSSKVSCTKRGENLSLVSGPEADIKIVIETAKINNAAHIQISLSTAFNRNNMAIIKTSLHQQLQKIIGGNRISSPKWISTSINDKNRRINFAVSPEYFCNALINPFDLDEWFSDYRHNSIVIEMSPEPVIATLLTNISLRKNMHFLQILSCRKNSVIVSFLESLGKIGNSGGNLDLNLLYPAVELPVSRSTPMISPLIKWDHEKDWFVVSQIDLNRVNMSERFLNLTSKDDDYEFISGHVIDGRNLFPATGYLYLVWETISLNTGFLPTESPVVFENVRFIRATNMPKGQAFVDFIVTIQRSSGYFEIMESGAVIVTGTVHTTDDLGNFSYALPDNFPLDPNDDLYVLKAKDIYKELRLRGYNYKGVFKSISCATLDGTMGFIKWQKNWISFMDNMLQMQILNTDSRGLFVPTGLSRVVINPKKHLEVTLQLEEDNQDIPVYNSKHLKLVRSGGIEFRGLHVSAITRKKPLGEPVLEKYQFFPYHHMDESLNQEEIVRLFVHIILENNPTISVKVHEIGEIKNDYVTYLSESIIKALTDLPLIQPDVTVWNPQQGKLDEDLPPELKTEKKNMPVDQSALIVIGSDLFDPANSQALETCVNSAKEAGFIITRDKTHPNVTSKNVVLCSTVICDGIYYSLIKKVKTEVKKIASISVSNESFSWIESLKSLLKSVQYNKVVIYSQNQPISGILGLVNCITKEGYSQKARCFFILDPHAPPFALDNPLYADQLEKDMALNIYKDGQWGSYRHLLLDCNDKIDSQHAYISFLSKGDLSSAEWTEGNLSKPLEISPNTEAVHVYYSALNFRDIMTATGKLAHEVVEKNRIFQDCVQGLEFSGRLPNGRKIMGMVGAKGIANVVDPKYTMSWDVPDNWTLEEAATVPCVYTTIIYAFDIVGHPQKGDTILVHAGTGGIGQATIHYALHHGCEVFTTVGTPEKREFIKKTFPQLTDNRIGNTRDTSFEELIMRETDGRGVDFVLNSLAEEKLLASVRCLAKGGRFLELGKFDIANNSPLGMEFLNREASFHGIMLDVRSFGDNKSKNALWCLINDAISKGACIPLTRTVFERDQIENAFRFMGAGKHMGKVLIKIRDEETAPIHLPKPLSLKATPRFYCDENKSYVVLGGLGGFGLELTDWLILRGARHIILSSRSGVKEGYQSMRINVWQSYGATVDVFSDDVTSEEGVISLLKKSNAIAPVGGIFNLAVVLRDAIFDNQNEEEFIKSFGPKATATRYLDRYSRKMCPQLEHFVVFSSVSCGRGNAGQTNYGMSNSVMERICEQRHNDGLPAIAIQWGAVGDVGLVANMQEQNSEIVIGGTLPQKIDSCLSVMDMFLNKKYPIVASMVVAEKKRSSGENGNIMDTVLEIIGVKDLKSVNIHSNLAELGMDSMMAVEIKQTLEREFEVFLSPQDIRGMTFAKLQDIAAAKTSSGDPQEVTTEATRVDDIKLVRTVGDESSAAIPIIKSTSLYIEETQTPNYDHRIFFLPGIEGFGSVFQVLCSNISYECYCVQYDYTSRENSIQDIAKLVYERIQSYIHKDHVVRLVAYSFGGMVSLELIKLLQEFGFQAKVCIIDGSPDIFKQLVHFRFDTKSDENFQLGVLLSFVDLLLPQEKKKVETVIKEYKGWEAKLQALLNITETNKDYSDMYKKSFVTCIYERLKSIPIYQDIARHSLKSSLKFLRPEVTLFPQFEEDYGLSKYFEKEVEIHVVEGDHSTILDSIETANYINTFMSIQ